MKKSSGWSTVGAMQLEMAGWTLGGLGLLSSGLVWWQARQPAAGELTVYEVFPLFGLVAFSLMWTHFITGALRRYWQVRPQASRYQTVSMYAVLACIVAHPALLWVALWRDDFGLPPTSQYLAFGGTAILNAALFAGMVALTLFLAYELKYWLGDRTWWRYIEWLQLPAMALIFLHGLTLGGELAIGWYLVLWYLYGVTLLGAVGYSWYVDVKNKESQYAVRNQSK